MEKKSKNNGVKNGVKMKKSWYNCRQVWILGLINGIDKLNFQLITKSSEILNIKTMIQKEISSFILAIIILQGANSQCCLQFMDNICQKCPDGMHLYRGNCIFDVPNCLSYLNGFDCQTCQQGYQLDQDTKCVQIQVQDQQTDGQAQISLQSTQAVLETGLTIQSQQTTVQIVGQSQPEVQMNLRESQIDEEDEENNETIIEEQNITYTEEQKQLLITSLKTRNGGLTLITDEQRESEERFGVIDGAVREIPYIAPTVLLVYFDYGLSTLSLYSCYYWNPIINITYQVVVVWDIDSSSPQLESVSSVQV